MLCALAVANVVVIAFGLLSLLSCNSRVKELIAASLSHVEVHIRMLNQLLFLLMIIAMQVFTLHQLIQSALALLPVNATQVDL